MMWSLLGLAAAADAWELAGLYDATAVARVGASAPAPAGGAAWVWQAPAGMLASCGPPKAPDGLGLMEAQAVANGLTPTLAILLRRAGADAAPLDTRTVRVALALPEGALQVPLAPMVEPSWTTVTVSGTGLEAHQQQVRTQIAMETCLQHKTGRHWVGGDGAGLREAFLLDRPEPGRTSDRTHFRGQRTPVPALLGPLDACFDEASGDRGGDAAVWTSGSGGGAVTTSLSLVPADVWGASLRACALDEVAGGPVRDARPRLPLSVGGDGAAVTTRGPAWRRLEVEVHGQSEADATIEVRLDGEPLTAALPLFRRTPDSVTNTEKLGLQDVLAAVPGRYPTAGDAGDPERYTVLLVPNWQLVEAANQLQGRGWSAADTVTDGVGWVLEHPEVLRVQVGPEGAGTLPNLTSQYGGWHGRLLRWGYMVGMYAGRSEVVLPSESAPTWEQAERAQRSRQHALFLGSAGVLGLLLLAGLRRLPDLWVRVPEERVSYWPGAAEPPAEGAGPATPLGALEGGDE